MTSERDLWIIGESHVAWATKFAEVIQERIDAVDHEAAANGNLWLQGRLSGLRDVLDDVEAAKKKAEEILAIRRGSR